MNVRQTRLSINLSNKPLFVLWFCVCLLLGQQELLVYSKVCLSNSGGTTESSKTVNLPGSFGDNLVIFPSLTFQCSGIVTHLKLSLDDSRSKLCEIDEGNSIRTVKFPLYVLENLDQTDAYRFLSISTFSVATEEVRRQCTGQDEAHLDLELAYDGEADLLVRPGLVIGLSYPVTVLRESLQIFTKDNKTSSNTSASSSHSLNLHHVASSERVLQTAEKSPQVDTILVLERSNLTFVPLLDVSIGASTADILGNAVAGVADQRYNHFTLMVIIIAAIVGIVANTLCLAVFLLCLCKSRPKGTRKGSKHYYSYPRLFRRRSAPPQTSPTNGLVASNANGVMDGITEPVSPHDDQVQPSTAEVNSDYMYVNRESVERMDVVRDNLEASDLEYV